MKKRDKLLSQLIKQPSILACVGELSSNWAQLIESSELRLKAATELEMQGKEAAKAWVAFIRNQDDENFNTYREVLGIPSFSEGLVEISDFKKGFMWRFRAHTSSWSENQYADQWFFTSLEARSVTQYEFWSCDEGINKLEFVLEGSYKEILQQLLADHVHEVLISPAFSSEELAEYIANFSEDEEDYMLEDVIEDYISQNPNFAADKI